MIFYIISPSLSPLSGKNIFEFWKKGSLFGKPCFSEWKWRACSTVLSSKSRTRFLTLFMVHCPRWSATLIPDHLHKNCQLRPSFRNVNVNGATWPGFCYPDGGYPANKKSVFRMGPVFTLKFANHIIRENNCIYWNHHGGLISNNKKVNQ